MVHNPTLARRGAAMLLAACVLAAPARVEAGHGPAVGEAATAPADRDIEASAAQGVASSPPTSSPPSSTGVAGPVVDTKDAQAATQELEGGPSLAGADATTPVRMPPMETAAWWTLFGAVALATTGGVLAGLAEREEDRALSLATEVDPETGMQPLYESRSDEYETALERGETLQFAAWGVLAASGAAVVAAITLFAVNARRGRAPERSARWVPGRLEVRF